MHRRHSVATSIALAILLQPQATAGQNDYQATFQGLMSIAPDTRTAAVTDLTIVRDAATFDLHQGQLYVLTPVRDRVVGAFFIGSGTFSFTPATAVERGQLRRHMKTVKVHDHFKTLFLLFADTTMRELERTLEFTTGPPSGDVRRELREALEYLSDDDSEWFDTDLMTTFLNRAEDGTFYAHLAARRGDPLIFRINPRNGEEVSLSRRSPDAKVAELVVSQHTTVEHAQGEFERADEGDLVSLGNYTIESTIESNLDFSARASFDVESLGGEVSWAPLSLYHELEVDNVWAEGTQVTWQRGDENSVVWIHFAPALQQGVSRRVTLAYHGDLLKRADLLKGLRLRGDVSRAWMIEMKSTSLWFPRSGRRRTATFDLTYHAPEKYVLVSVGDPVQSAVTDKVRTTRWKTREVRNVAFNIGDFEEYEFTDPRVPPITLHVAEKMHNSLVLYDRNGQPIPIIGQRDMDEMVISDLTNSMSFFQDFYGPATVNQFYATETPYYHGEAYPGVVLLSWVTFQWTDDKGNDDMFRAHEVAHQWWGIGVDFATYRDQWISEGFSEFAGLWYMQIIRLNNELYFEKLDDWRKALLDRRKDIGPISLGYRLSTSKHPGDYSLVVYKKGAWVLHMLRSLLLDLTTMKEDRFKALMSDFYQTYRGERASTDDFQKMVEDHIGAPMDWFFDQWVHGTGIPTYRVSYSGEDTPEGFKARIKVIQEDVADDFRMVVPVLLDFGTDGYAHVRVMVEGPVSDLELPLLPRKPDKIVFNDLESVLADVKDDGWRK